MYKFRKNFIRKLTAGVLTAALLTGCGAAAADGVNESGALQAAEAAEDNSIGEDGADTDHAEDGGEESTGKPRLMEEDEEEITPSRAIMNARQSHDVGDSVIYPEQKKNQKKKYSILVYMIGSDLEASHGYASADMKEMENSGIDFTDNNLIVYAGGSRLWKTDIPSNRNNILDMSREAGDRVVAHTEDTSDMGSPDTLAAFLDYAVEYYPAEHYALFFWDHGGGSVYGYGNDTLYRGDSLLLSEMEKVMSESPFREGGKARLDLVGFDACLMSTAENALVWSEYADYMIASEETEPGDGWCYHFLDVFNGTDSAEEIGRAIIDEYSTYYAEKRSPLNDPDITLALLDLKEMTGLVEGINGLVLAMQKEIRSDYFPDLVRTRTATKMFGVRDSRSEAYDLLDLGDLAYRVKTKFPKEASTVQSALGDVIAYSTEEVDGSCGLSIYFPGENRELYEAVEESGGETMYVSSEFADFVKVYSNLWMTASDADWTVPTPVNNGNEVTVQLTEEQMKNLDKATYTVLTDEGNGGYRRALCKVEVKPDDQNVLHIPTDPALFCAANGTETMDRPCAFAQVEDRGNTMTYDSMGTCFSYGENMMDSPCEHITVTLEEREGSIRVKSFCYDDSVVAVGGKNTVDIFQYTAINEYIFDSLYPTRGEDGTMLPYYRWDSASGGIICTPLNIDDSFCFMEKHASELKQPTVVQVILRDINGGEHGSDICALSAGRSDAEKDTVSLDTPKGTLTFEIREGAAYLTDYTGDDRSLELPEKVEGYPLKGLDYGSINSAATLRTLEIPEGVTTIGRHVIGYTPKLKELILPSTLELVDEKALGHGTEELEKITVKGTSKAVTSIDGVLFSADGKKLLKYPAKKGRSYTVPEGTETIAYDAFYKADLVEIEFPETLKNIDNYAFEGCRGLDALIFPESLERIGAGAFSEGIVAGDEDPARLIESVTLGANVSVIGPEAFTGYPVVGFDVSEDNPVFSSVNGMIMSKAGDVLVYCPEEIGGSVILPEGVTGLTAGVFSELPATTVFYFPDSLTRMNIYDFPYTWSDNYDKEYDLTIYCSKGSAAETFAVRNKLNCQIAEREDLDLGSYVNMSVPAPNGSYRFRVYEDHAVFIAYMGSGSSIAVPSKVKGVPVTEIGDGDTPVYNADDKPLDLRNNADDDIEVTNLGRCESEKLRNVDIPDSVIRINNEAFSVMDIEQDVLRLPDHLETIGERAFGGKYRGSNIGSFAISEENPYFTVVDGVLFNKDCSELLKFPNNADTSLPALAVEKNGRDKRYVYQVPEGCRKIGPYAFVNLKLTDAYDKYAPPIDSFEVRLPSDVEIISDFAFYEARVSAVTLNEGLQIIGVSAFSFARLASDVLILPSTVTELGDDAFSYVSRKDENGDLVYGFSRIELPDDLKVIGRRVFANDSEHYYTCDQLVIGKKLKKIDTEAFCDLCTLAYEVNEKNPAFSSKDGCLLSKDGAKLIQVPRELSGIFHVPEGVTDIGECAFYDCDNISDIYIGPEVTHINPRAIYTDETEPVIHGQAGSEAERFADSKGFEWREES